MSVHVGDQSRAIESVRCRARPLIRYTDEISCVLCNELPFRVNRYIEQPAARATTGPMDEWHRCPTFNGLTAEMIQTCQIRDGRVKASGYAPQSASVHRVRGRSLVVDV